MSISDIIDEAIDLLREAMDAEERSDAYWHEQETEEKDKLIEALSNELEKLGFPLGTFMRYYNLK